MKGFCERSSNGPQIRYPSVGCKLPLDGLPLSAHLDPWKLFQADIARLSNNSWEMDSKLKGVAGTVDNWRASEKKGFSVKGNFFKGMASAPSYRRNGEG